MGVTECVRERSLRARVRAGVFVCVRVRVYVRNLQITPEDSQAMVWHSNER